MFHRYTRCLMSFKNRSSSIILVSKFTASSSSGTKTYQQRQDEGRLERHLRTLIKWRGPIPMADYMREALTSPLGGYYMKEGDVFGSKGDFITSPEISSLFGEVLGLWFILVWRTVPNLSKPFHLVELGPGRGTLMSDMLRIIKQFPDVYSALEQIDLVETSPTMRLLQYQTLKSTLTTRTDESSLAIQQAKTEDGLPIAWYSSMEDLPKVSRFLVAHEFLDALPVHVFSKTLHGWRELLVDLDTTAPEFPKFVLIESPRPTPALVYLDTSYFKACHLDSMNQIEVCPSAASLVERLCKDFKDHPGVALLIDYGDAQPFENSLRGIQGHRFVNLLERPGHIDLSAHVDFGYLSHVIRENQMRVHGPISQSFFLKSMGIRERLQQVLRHQKNMTHITTQSLVEGVEKLIDPSDMGQKFKCMAISGPSVESLTGFS